MTTAIIFDTETHAKKDGEIVEAAWLQFAQTSDLVGPSDRIDLTIINVHSQRYLPSKPITFGSMAVHHILPFELEGCPPSSSFAFPDPCDYIVGHSIDTDWIAAGAPSHIKRICTHAMAQWLWPDATGYSQSALIYMLEGSTPETRAMLKGAHSAIADIHINHGLLRHILKLKPEITNWEQLWEYSELCRIPRTCPMKKYEGVLLADLEAGFINWCLGLHDLDPYYRKGLEQVLDARFARAIPHWDEPQEVDEDDSDRLDDDSREGPEDMEAQG